MVRFHPVICEKKIVEFVDSIFCEISYAHRRMCLEIKPHVMFYVNHNLI